MRILLVKPCWPYPYTKGEDTYNRIFPPLCLLNCAAFLEKDGYNVSVLDAHAQRIKPDKLKSYVKDYDKIFVTSSSLDRWQCPNIDITPFLEAVRCIKETSEEVYVMGYHGTVEPEKILNLTGVKAVIMGEPENTALDICKGGDLTEIKGVSFEHGKEVVSTAKRELLNLENMPVPAFHLLNFNRYSYEILGGRFSLFEINRGCSFKCRFCNKVMYGDTLRTKTERQVFDELTQAIEKFNVKTGYFMDLDFLSNRDMANNVCEYLIKKNYRFKWTCQARIDRLDNEIVKKMKRAGCAIIHLGAETGSQRLLDYLNKGITIERIEKAVRICKSAGIKTLVFFLVGLPLETEKDRIEALDFFKKINPDFVSFHKLFPYKGTGICQDKLVFNKDLDEFIRYGLLQYYLRPLYLRNFLPSFALGGFRLFLRRMQNLI